jgi:hypothetical protein
MSKKKKKKVVQATFKVEKYIQEAARKLPFYKAYLDPDALELGLGGVIVSRKRPNGDILFCSYVVDTRCCGVKDIFYEILSEEGFHSFVKESGDDMETTFQEVEVNHAANVIYASVEYADALGIQPHGEFDLAELILPDVDDIEYEDIQCGLDGKPHYTYFPGDKPTKILDLLEEAVGIEGFTYDYQEGDEEEDYLDDEDYADDEEWADDDDEEYTEYEEIKE